MPRWLDSDEREVAYRWGTLTGLLALLALALILVTAGASHLYYPEWLPFVFFALIFPVHLRTVLLLIQLKGAQDRAETGGELAALISPFPLPFERRVSYIVMALYAAAAILVVLGLRFLGGQPEAHGGHFFLNDHGKLTEVSRAAYNNAVIAQARLFSGFAAVFLGLGAVINLRDAKRPTT